MIDVSDTVVISAAITLWVLLVSSNSSTTEVSSGSGCRFDPDRVIDCPPPVGPTLGDRLNPEGGLA